MNQRPSTHEDLARPNDVQAGSERGFGFVFAGFCAIVAAFMLWHGRPAYGAWIGAAALFAVLAVYLPRALRPLNLLWFRFGLLLHHIISPVVLGLMFYTVFTPIGLWMRMVGKRPLHLRFDPAAETYWMPRDPPGPPAESFKNQF